MNLTQRRLLSPTFAFTRELVNGRIRGFESSKVAAASTSVTSFSPKSSRLPMRCSRRFATFVARRSGLQDLGGRCRSVPVVSSKLELRFNLVTAAYGRVMGDRVFIITDDPQVAKAVDVLPKARDLAMSSADRKSRRIALSRAITYGHHCASSWPLFQT